MKKYNIFSLFVVEVQYNNENHYLICKYSVLNNTYTEIFTNEEIKVIDNSKITPLSSYYSPLGVCDYSTGKPLMLNKKDLLRKYITINCNMNTKVIKQMKY